MWSGGFVPGFDLGWVSVSLCNSDHCMAQVVTFDSVVVTSPAGVVPVQYLPVPGQVVQTGTGYRFVWYNVSVGAGGCIWLGVRFWTDTTLFVGDTLCFDVAYYGSALSGQGVVCGEVLGSYDPNDKQVFPQGVGERGVVAPGTELQYRIRFQNTGTWYAYHVRILDTLDVNLDFETFQVLDASHSYKLYTYTLPSGQVVLKFAFENIMLPDSGRDYWGSQGYVVFRIKPKGNVALGTEIRNRAGIYFDYNPVVMTNEVVNTVDVLSGVEVGVEEGSVKVYPNPVGDWMRVKVEGGGNVGVVLYDLRGVALRRMEGVGEVAMDVSDLAGGLYMLRVETVKGYKVYRVVVRR
jgi:uncharacterized repeat protein (TIGR01451 family)